MVLRKHPIQACRDRGQDGLPLQADRITDGRSGGPRDAVTLDALSNPPPGQGMREGTGLELVNATKQFGGRKHGLTVS